VPDGLPIIYHKVFSQDTKVRLTITPDANKEVQINPFLVCTDQAENKICEIDMDDSKFFKTTFQETEIVGKIGLAACNGDTSAYKKIPGGWERILHSPSATICIAEVQVGYEIKLEWTYSPMYGGNFIKWNGPTSPRSPYYNKTICPCEFENPCFFTITSDLVEMSYLGYDYFSYTCWAQY